LVLPPLNPRQKINKDYLTVIKKEGNKKEGRCLLV
jgi:hypothetical protein